MYGGEQVASWQPAGLGVRGKGSEGTGMVTRLCAGMHEDDDEVVYWHEQGW